MASTRDWFKHDAWFLADDKIRELGHEFGASGPLVAEALLELAKRQRAAGEVEVRWGYLAEHAFVKNRSLARRIVASCERLEFVVVLEQDDAGVRLSIVRWRAIQGAGLQGDGSGNGARRMALHRDPELRAEIRERDGDLCRYCGVEVQWANRRGSHGGTYDHVDPYGGNEIANLVVACRGCNARKRAQTPDEAGMRLLAPRFRSGVNGSKSDLDLESVKLTPEEEVETETAKAVSSSAASRTDQERERASDEDKANCRLFIKLLREHNPKAPIKSESEWLRQMRLLRERDDNSGAEIGRLIRWMFTNTGKDARFWASTIQSPAGLREHFAQVWAKMTMAATDAPNVESSTALLARRGVA